MSREYETLVILKALGTDAELTQSVKHVEDLIKKLGGQIRQSASWGRRRLAYPIARQQEGTYYLLQFQIAPDRLMELKRLFRLNETIVRFLVLSQENHQPGSPLANPKSSESSAAASMAAGASSGAAKAS